MKKLFLYTSTVLFLFGCGENQNTATNTASIPLENTTNLTAIQQNNVGITLGKMELKTLSNVLKVNGKIELPPQSIVSISVPLGGYVKSTKLLPGMAVRKGQAIATLEDIQYIQLQQDYLSTKEKLRFTEKEFQRQKELNLSKASSDKVLEQIELEFQNQKIALKSLSEKLLLLNIQPNSLSENQLTRGITIYSPINGYVSKADVNIGKYVQASDVLFELIDLSNLHLTIKVFEKDINKLLIGQKTLAFNNAQPNIIYESEVILISKDIAPDGSIEVHCRFTNPDKNLFPGMYMNGEIEVNSNEVYSLPEEAVLTYEKKNYVFIAVNNDQFELKEVTIGEKEHQFIEIKNAEELKDKNIVIKGAYAILMKMMNIEDED
jgi:cobalt-zinc-cadmium efflux system membrane fusion protein